MTAPTLSSARKAIRAKATPGRAKTNAWFFKCGPREYGEGDRFLGVCVPDLRKLARAFAGLPHEATLQLLASPWHEERLLALLILVAAFDAGTPHQQKS